MASLTFEGGLNEQDVSLVNLAECISGYNFELGTRNTHFNPRKPFDLLGTATNAGAINGFVQLIKNDNTSTTLVQANDTVYEWDGTTTFTSRGTVSGSSRLRGVTWSLGGYSVIVDVTKNTVVKKWDGASLTTLTTGLASPLYAKYGLVHLNRVWLFNVTSGTATPHLCVASAFEDPESYSIANRSEGGGVTANLAFYMLTPDLKPINGVSLFFNTLIVSTEGGNMWSLAGTDATNFRWEPWYPGSSAIGTETMGNIGDDVVFMRKDGVIESVRSTADFGDVKTDDLSLWIRTTSSGLTDCLTVYDQSRQKVYFFISSNKVLVLFKEMLSSELSPWSVYKTNHASSFSTNAAIYMRRPGTTSTGNYYVYWGDSSGRVFQMEGASSADAGDAGSTSIDTVRKTRYIDDIEDLDTRLMQLRGRIEYRRISEVDLLMDFEWADDYAINRCAVPLSGPAAGDASNYWGGSAYWGGAYYWNQGFQLALRTSTKGFSPVGRGPGFYLTTTVQSKQSFDVLKISV